MRRRVHWTTLVPWLALLWCVEVIVDHYWVADTWERALHAGLFQIPVLVGLGFFTLRRAKRQQRAAEGSSSAALPSPPPE
jgi:hypothetical protein